jgi:hypothetical protein
MNNSLAFFWLYSLSLCFLVTDLAAQSLMVRFTNSPASGDRIRILCELNGTLVYQTQFDYPPGTPVLKKEIQLPPGTGYQLRATVTKGLGKLPLIVASGKADLDIAAGVQETTIVLSPPRATLVLGPAVQGGITVLFRYDDDKTLLRAEDVTTLWCSDKNFKVNASGRQSIAPLKLGADGRLSAVFVVPTSDRISYCQAGYYSANLTPSGQIPVFAYPDLTSSASPLKVGALRSSIQPSSATTSDAETPQKAITTSVITTRTDGHLERRSVTGQQ